VRLAVLQQSVASPKPFRDLPGKALAERGLKTGDKAPRLELPPGLGEAALKPLKLMLDWS
jgi:hypothetical protein